MNSYNVSDCSKHFISFNIFKKPKGDKKRNKERKIRKKGAKKEKKHFIREEKNIMEMERENGIN